MHGRMMLGELLVKVGKVGEGEDEVGGTGGKVRRKW